jgi:hypothetical protein
MSPLRSFTFSVSDPQRARYFRSLTLVLYGNSPRFSWMPSATMLLYRLMALQSLRCLRGPNESNSTEYDGFSRVADRASRSPMIFCPHGEPATGSTLLLLVQVILTSRFRVPSARGVPRPRKVKNWPFETPVDQCISSFQLERTSALSSRCPDPIEERVIFL